VVIGAGIAGLAVARTLSGRFATVVVLDRDRLPDDPSPRRGAPQTYHAHVLLGAGQRALEALFPGLHDELVAAGAVPFDPGLDLRFYRYGALWPAVRSGLRLVSMSRPLLEWTIRRRVAGLPNVTIRDGVAVSGLAGTGRRVTGLTIDGTTEHADLVVDCSGRSTRSDRWLGALGLPTPETQEVKVGIGYATRLYRRKPGDLTDGVGVLTLPTPPGERRTGIMLPIEDDRWLVALGGWHGAHAPPEEQGYLEYARSLPLAFIADLLERAEPVSDFHAHQFPSSRRRLFEQVGDLPAGYLAAGDAICSFNPVYGQGMTCAALEAIALGEALDRRPAADGGALARDFYRAAARIFSVPWRFAVGADFAYPQTTGPRPRGLRLLNPYSLRLQKVAQVDPAVRREFTSVQHLLTPPSRLFRPRMVAKVLRGPRNARRGA
jgi:2-polyprenyl-6-methoxyphenol hydroxylase-like FAD-dependent oxidoreductase